MSLYTVSADSYSGLYDELDQRAVAAMYQTWDTIAGDDENGQPDESTTMT